MAFAIFLKQPNSEGIKDAFRRIGIADFDWNRVGSLTQVQSAFGTRRTSDTSKAIESYLEHAAKVRNNIVHRGEGLEPVTEADVRYGMKIIEVLAAALKQVLERYCAEKCA
jgi:hypothetical protein